MKRFVCLLLLGSSSALFAQGDNAAAELTRLQRLQQEKRGEANELLDLRIRHDLGLPVAESADALELEAPMSTDQVDRARLELQREESTTNDYRQRYDRLREQMAQLEREAKTHAEEERKLNGWVGLPKANEVQRPGGLSLSPREPGAPAQQVPADKPASPAVMALPNLDPVRGQIQGSMDHSMVAQALFRAGKALLDRAALLHARGLEEAAVQCDDGARDRLQRALDSLKEAMPEKVEQAEFVDLFYQGKCLELLFRLDERQGKLGLGETAREYRKSGEYQRRQHEVLAPFTVIDARDYSTLNGKQVPGSWALAARSASEHFRWMNLNAGFVPQIQLESIQWGTGQQ